MKIAHVALWVRSLEREKTFYETYFDGKTGDKYINKKKGFESYFIAFDDGMRLELMKRNTIQGGALHSSLGWAHIAFSLGSKKQVDKLTEKLKNDGYTLISGPRITGDGYYESVFEDPEGNLIELSV